MALLERVNELKAKAEEKPHKRNIILELQAEKLRVKRIMNYRTKGAILRSKVRWHEQGERNTKYLYGLEKRNFNNKTITRLKIGENAFISNQSEILTKEKSCYESLYKTNQSAL